MRAKPESLKSNTIVIANNRIIGQDFDRVRFIGIGLAEHNKMFAIVHLVHL